MLSPFCDYLNVSFAPDDCPFPEVNRLLLAAGFDLDVFQGKHVYRPPQPYQRGTVVVEHRSKWALISASGTACAALRSGGLWMDYLSALASSPHTVTRLDASLDLPVDGADFIDRLHAKHPASVNLTRKAVDTGRILATRPDGRATGTWTAGYGSSAKVTATVYDKAWEALKKRGEILPPTTRVEIHIWKGYGATLRDAAEPSAIFWHTAAPALLNAPEGVPMWEPNADTGWAAKPRAFDGAAVLRRRVESLGTLDGLLLIADEMGPGGRDYLLHLLTQRVRASGTDDETAAA